MQQGRTSHTLQHSARASRTSHTPPTSQTSDTPNFPLPELPTLPRLPKLPHSQTPQTPTLHKLYVFTPLLTSCVPGSTQTFLPRYGSSTIATCRCVSNVTAP